MQPPSAYHQAVLQALTDSSVCSEQQLEEVAALLRGLSGLHCAADGPQIWFYIASRLLLPSHPFKLHQQLAAAVYDTWPAAALGRAPLWLPEAEEAAGSNAGRFIESLQGRAWWCAAGGASPLPRTCDGLLGGWLLLQRLSWEAPEAVWPALLGHMGVRFEVPPSRALLRHPSDPDRCRWLPGARLNIADVALRQPHPRAPPGHPALVWAAEGRPQQLHRLGRHELRARALHAAAAIRKRFKPGDALALYLPLTPAAACLYLGCVLAGCVAVSVADSFSAEELRTRLDIARAVGVFTQDVVVRGGKALPLYGKVLRSGTPAVAVVLPSTELEGFTPAAASAPASSAAPPLRPGDVPWAAFLAGATPQEAAAFQPHIADAYDTTNILFSSGTTGEPKAIPWSHVTPLRCAVDGWAHLDVRPGGCLCWPTSLGWMMGPWLLYAGLVNGATVALYTGSPLGLDFLQFVSAARVEVLGLVPSIVRAWRQGGVLEAGAGPGAGRGHAAEAAPDLSCVRVFGSTGEASSAEDYHWLMSRVRGYRPVIEYCGGTELGGAYLSSTPLHPAAPSTFTTATLGTRLVLLPPGGAAEGAEAAAGGADGLAVFDGASCSSDAGWGPGPQPGRGSAPGAGCGVGWGVSGEVALAMPMLGASQRLLNKDHAKVYYTGMPLYGGTGLPLRRHGDELAAMPPLCLGAARGAGAGAGAVSYCALGRCDDTMNLGGIKVSSVELERAVVEGVAGVAEAAAVGVAPPAGGPEELHLFLVLAPPPQQQQQQRPEQAGQGAQAGAAVSREQLGALHAQCTAAVRSKLNPLFKVSRVAVVPCLPRNASNKVMRRVLRDELPGRARL